MNTVLMSWIGATDLRCIHDERPEAKGPLASVIRAVDPDRVVLLNDYGGRGLGYVAALGEDMDRELEVHSIDLTSPMAFDQIYGAVRPLLDGVLREPAVPALGAEFWGCGLFLYNTYIPDSTG